ncbi:MAG: hypothetical protein ACREEM_38795 [Blastocatellia bacterium]
MWKDLFDLVRQALRLAEDTQKTKAELIAASSSGFASLRPTK